MRGCWAEFSRGLGVVRGCKNWNWRFWTIHRRGITRNRESLIWKRRDIQKRGKLLRKRSKVMGGGREKRRRTKSCTGTTEPRKGHWVLQAMREGFRSLSGWRWPAGE